MIFAQQYRKRAAIQLGRVVGVPDRNVETCGKLRDPAEVRVLRWRWITAHAMQEGIIGIPFCHPARVRFTSSIVAAPVEISNGRRSCAARAGAVDSPGPAKRFLSRANGAL